MTPPPLPLAAGVEANYLVSITLVSLYVSTTAVLLSALLSLPTATAIAFSEFRGKRLVTSIVNTGMGLPSVVVGLLVLIALSRSGPIGGGFELPISAGGFEFVFAFGGVELLFTPEAMIVSQTVLATPVVLSVSLSAIEGVDRELRDAAYAAGATSTDVALVVLREARFGIVTAILAGYGRAISEVGSVLIVGGNVVFSDGTSYTRTLTTAITLEARRGNVELGLALGAILLALVLTVNLLAARFRDGGRP